MIGGKKKDSAKRPRRGEEKGLFPLQAYETGKTKTSYPSALDRGGGKGTPIATEEEKAREERKEKDPTTTLQQ